jgi:hypothetical protein
VRVPRGIIRCPRHLSRLLQVARIRKIVRRCGPPQPQLRNGVIWHLKKKENWLLITGTTSGVQPKGPYILERFTAVGKWPFERGRTRSRLGDPPDNWRMTCER